MFMHENFDMLSHYSKQIKSLKQIITWYDIEWYNTKVFINGPESKLHFDIFYEKLKTNWPPLWSSSIFIHCLHHPSHHSCTPVAHSTTHHVTCVITMLPLIADCHLLTTTTQDPGEHPIENCASGTAINCPWEPAARFLQFLPLSHIVSLSL